MITGGIGTFTPRPLPVGDEYLGRGLVHFVPDPTTYAGCDVVVVGGGDSALDWALMLEPIAKSVTLVHRRAQFRAHAALGRPGDGVVDARCSPTRRSRAVRGEPERGRGGHRRRRARCARCRATGSSRRSGSPRTWARCSSGASRSRSGAITVDTRGRTTVPGIYAAGDIVEYDGKVKLIATGFGEVATAVNNIAAYLNPDVSAFPGHLSDYAPEPGSAGRPRPRDRRRRHRRRAGGAVRRGAGRAPVAGAASCSPSTSCRRPPAARRTAESLAARFAAKEALAKALGAGGGMSWTDAEVRTDDVGRPSLDVRGTVAARADSLGVTRWHISLSHDGGIASATVIAERD